MPERVQKTKCRGGVAEKKIEGDAGEGKEDEMQGGLKIFIGGGGVDHKKNLGGVSGKLCLL